MFLTFQQSTDNEVPKPVVAPPQPSQPVQKPPTSQPTSQPPPQLPTQPTSQPKSSSAFDLLGDLGGDPFASSGPTATGGSSKLKIYPI